MALVIALLALTWDAFCLLQSKLISVYVWDEIRFTFKLDSFGLAELVQIRKVLPLVFLLKVALHFLKPLFFRIRTFFLPCLLNDLARLRLCLNT